MNFTVIVNVIHSLAGHFARAYIVDQGKERSRRWWRKTYKQTHTRARFDWFEVSIVITWFPQFDIGRYWYKSTSAPRTHTQTFHNINISIFRKRKKGFVSVLDYEVQTTNAESTSHTQCAACHIWMWIHSTQILGFMRVKRLDF